VRWWTDSVGGVTQGLDLLPLGMPDSEYFRLGWLCPVSPLSATILRN
jgi:hypothetical protein